MAHPSDEPGLARAAGAALRSRRKRAGRRAMYIPDACDNGDAGAVRPWTAGPLCSRVDRRWISACAACHPTPAGTADDDFACTLGHAGRPFTSSRTVAPHGQTIERIGGFRIGGLVFCATALIPSQQPDPAC